MFHNSSISAQEWRTSSPSVRASSLMDPLSDNRIRYNLSELKGIVKHVGSQTDNTMASFGTSSAIELLGMKEHPDAHGGLQQRLDLVTAELEIMRERVIEREHLLIAQMNAIRDQHQLTLEERYSDKLEFKLYIRDGALDFS